LVKHKAVKPLIIVVYRSKTRSSQPQRRFRPVVTPHSLPRVCKCSPISYINFLINKKISKYFIVTFLSSVGKTPSPTRVV
jgi:hypothetical protein